MERRILFISSEKGFLIKAMLQNIEAAGFSVVTAEPDVAQLTAMQDLPAISIVYLEGDINSFSDTLKYLKLKEGVIEGNRRRALYLIGTPTEIAVALETIPKNFVTASFTRPVNVKDIIAQLDLLLENNPGTGGKKRVLVVDDDSVMLRTMKNWLSAKYDVYMANSGMNAISLLAKMQVDLILLDYEMPVVSGLQVFEMLKSEEKTRNIPVIFLTAKDDRETVVKVLAAKPEKYLLKTLPPEELIRSIDDFFKGWK